MKKTIETKITKNGKLTVKIDGTRAKLQDAIDAVFESDIDSNVIVIKNHLGNIFTGGFSFENRYMNFVFNHTFSSNPDKVTGTYAFNMSEVAIEKIANHQFAEYKISEPIAEADPDDYAVSQEAMDVAVDAERELANSEAQTSTPIINIADYNTMMTWAEKISNGQRDAVTPIVTYLSKLGYTADKQDVFNAIDTDDLNGFRRYISQFPFLVKDDAGYIQKLYVQADDEVVLAEIPTCEYPNVENNAPEFKYYIKSRRPIAGAVPNGYISATAGEMKAYSLRSDGSISPVPRKVVFGVVAYDHPLTDEQILNYDLHVDPRNPNVHSTSDYKAQTNWTNPHDFTTTGDFADSALAASNSRLAAFTIKHEAEIELATNNNEPVEPKFETGKTYYIKDGDSYYTLKVESRTAKMLTGTTEHGTRKYHVHDTFRGEYVGTDLHDEFGNAEMIWAANEFKPEVKPEVNPIIIERLDAEREYEELNQVRKVIEKDVEKIERRRDRCKGRSKKRTEYNQLLAELDPIIRAFGEKFITAQDRYNKSLTLRTDEERAATQKAIDTHNADLDARGIKYFATVYYYPNGVEGEDMETFCKDCTSLNEANAFVSQEDHDGVYVGGIYDAGWQITDLDGNILADHISGINNDAIKNLVLEENHMTPNMILAAQIVSKLGNLIIKFSHAGEGNNGELALHYDTFTDKNDELGTPLHFVEVFTDQHSFILHHVNLITGFDDDKTIEQFFFDTSAAIKAQADFLFDKITRESKPLDNAKRLDHAERSKLFRKWNETLLFNPEFKAAIKYMTAKHQKRSVIGTYRFDLGLTLTTTKDDRKFLFQNAGLPVAIYDTPEQVSNVIDLIKLASELGLKEFTFPKVDQLNDTWQLRDQQRRQAIRDKYSILNANAPKGWLVKSELSYHVGDPDKPSVKFLVSFNDITVATLTDIPNVKPAVFWADYKLITDNQKSFKDSLNRALESLKVDIRTARKARDIFTENQLRTLFKICNHALYALK